MEEIIEDGLIRFAIDKKIINSGYIEIIVYEFNQWEENDCPTACETYLGVPIKFDGGFHFNFGSEGYLYLTGEDIETHCRLMKRIHEIAKEHFNNEYI